MMFGSPPTAAPFQARGVPISIGVRPLVMGILNVTPDSFWTGGRYLAHEAAIQHGCRLVEEGADLLDIGAESSRPGSEPLEEAEEIRRLIPVVEELARKTTVPLSVDTWKAAVARLALDAGASIINDISALRFDSAMGPLVADTGAGVILMHMKGQPRTMQENPSYQDVVGEVSQFLGQQMVAATRMGIRKNQILLDPGIGFGKTLEQNLLLLKYLNRCTALGRPVVVGLSRKSFIGHILGREVAGRLMGTAGAVIAAVRQGVQVVRVHDVGPIREALAVVEAIEQAESSRHQT